MGRRAKKNRLSNARSPQQKASRSPATVQDRKALSATAGPMIVIAAVDYRQPAIVVASRAGVTLTAAVRTGRE